MVWRTLLALLLAALALAGVALALRSGNARIARRYLQWWSPPLTLLYAWLAFELRDRLPSAAEIAAWLERLPRLPDLADGAILEALQAFVALAAEQVPLLLIVLFLPVKWLGFLLHRLVRRWSVPAFWFYLLDAGERSAVLRPEWSYSRMLLSGAAWVALALLLYPVAQLGGWGEVSPLWPGLAFVILAESAWFFRGTPWRPDADGVGMGEPAASVDLDAIRRESRALFGRWLLGEQRVRLASQPAPRADPEQPCSDLDLSGWSDACCLLLDDLLSGESVVVEGALPQQVEPCLRYYLRDRVLRGGRLLVLVPDLADVASACAWTERLLRQPGWPVLGWEGRWLSARWRWWRRSTTTSIACSTSAGALTSTRCCCPTPTAAPAGSPPRSTR